MKEFFESFLNQKGGEDLSRKEEYEQKAEELITPIVEANGFELVDVEYVKEGGTWYLRAYIDKEGGITVDDCEIVSRAFSDRLDAEDFIDDAYIMEVSSPGLGRPLKKRKTTREAWEKSWKSGHTVRSRETGNFTEYSPHMMITV